VLCHRDAPANAPPGRPLIEVADVFRAHGEAYRQSRALSGEQSKVMRAIELCRTEALGGHLDVCPDCALERPAYNSCRDRHCPKCQSLVQARWLDRRLERVLDTHYFHVVFTIPAALRPLARANRRLLFDLLFASASRTLLDLGDDTTRLGARLGITAVLHTWTRELTFHPHLHCIVTGGGLAPDGEAWLPLNRRFIFPVRVLGDLFRGKFLDGLRRLCRDGSLRFTGGAANLADDDAFDRLLDRLYQTSWVVYAKRPFAGVEHVFRYLGRYTHRVGISNHRIQAFDDKGVRFATKDGKAVTIEPFEFIRRFLDHVLPAGFTKIRHFGLLASGNVNTKLEKARSLLARRATEHGKAEPPAAGDDNQSHAVAPLPTWQELLLRLTGIDPRRCPECGAVLIHKPLPTSMPSYEDTS
jgi:hypothetical protein